MKGAGRQRPCILVVEDSPTQACEVAAHLEESGFATVVAADGGEALAVLRDTHVDAVLSDVVMPGMGGYELCRRIRRNRLLRRLPVVLLTGLDDPADVLAGFEAGADNYVIKPYRPAELVARIRSVLRSQTKRGRTARIRLDVAGRRLSVRPDDPRVAEYFASTFAEMAEARRRELESRREGESLRGALRLFETGLDALASAVALLDAGGRVRHANRAWAGLDARLRGEQGCVGPLLAPVVAGVLEGPSAIAEREVAVDGDGGPLWFRVRAARLPGGTAARLVVSCEDVTALRRMAEIEREERAVEAALARAGRELMGASDTAQVLEWLARLARELLGGESGRTVLFATGASGSGTGEDRPRLRRRLSGGHPVERAVRCRGGVTGWRLYVPLWRNDGVAGYHAVTYGSRSEVTETRRRIAEGLARLASAAFEQGRLLEELDRANRVKSEFVNTMSHELRTPLHVVLGYSELLLDGTFGPLSDEQRDVLVQMDRNARSLAELVHATLDLSRLERGCVPLRIGETEVHRLADDLRGELWHAATKPHLRYEWELPAEPVRLRTDVGKLKIVIRNLVSNAIKFTDEGRVRVRFRSRGGGLEVQVSDTGIGIAPEQQEAIFEAFRQLDGSITRRYGGMGLGLYIARRLTHMLGGRIRVRSRPGRGSTFTVWIPRHLGANAPLRGDGGPRALPAQAAVA